MCGLAGVLFNNADQLIEKRFLPAAYTFLTKRGPDDFAHERVDENVLFIHTRLSIVDIATGHQPMHDGDGVIICDGEIYNYLELKKDKEIYRTNSDTEVLLCGIGRSGIDYLRSLLHNGLLINSLSLIC